MSTKLTLTIDKRIIEGAKQYAQEQGRSLSNLVENYLKVLIEDTRERGVEEGYSPEILSLKGALKAEAGADFDYERLLEDELLEKYNIKP